MTAINTDKCIFCGAALDAYHQSICQPCIDRYKQDHSQEFAEMRLYHHLRQIKSEKCLICGEPLDGNPNPVCPWCMEYIVEAEVKGENV